MYKNPGIINVQEAVGEMPETEKGREEGNESSQETPSHCGEVLRLFQGAKMGRFGEEHLQMAGKLGRNLGQAMGWVTEQRPPPAVSR